MSTLASSVKAKPVASEFVQRRINRLFEEAGEAISQLDWQVVNQRAHAVLSLEPANLDGIAVAIDCSRLTTGGMMVRKLTLTVGPSGTSRQPRDPQTRLAGAQQSVE